MATQRLPVITVKSTDLGDITISAWGTNGGDSETDGRSERGIFVDRL